MVERSSARVCAVRLAACRSSLLVETILRTEIDEATEVDVEIC